MRRTVIGMVAVVALGLGALGAWWRLRPGSGDPVGATAEVLCGGVRAERTGELPPGLVEVSGLVASRLQPGVLWVHNDSGDVADVYAIDRSGTLLGVFDVHGAQAVDWEDIALGPGSDGKDADALYVGDIGDNEKQRREIVVYRFPEPVVRAAAERLPATGGEGVDRRSAEGATTAPAERFVLRYPDGAHDAETLLLDPVSLDLFIVTKDLQGRSGVFRAAVPLDAGRTSDLERVRTLDLGAGGLATGGDVSASGDAIVVRTYTSVFVWGRLPGESVTDSFGRAPCRATRPADIGGEAVGLDPDGAGYTTTVEGEGAAIEHWHG